MTCVPHCRARVDTGSTAHVTAIGRPRANTKGRSTRGREPSYRVLACPQEATDSSTLRESLSMRVDEYAVQMAGLPRRSVSWGLELRPRLTLRAESQRLKPREIRQQECRSLHSPARPSNEARVGAHDGRALP